MTRRKFAPETWKPARQIAERVLRPIERFLEIEAASGIVLLVAALVALIWANSAWASSYEKLWHWPITLGIGSFVFTESIHFFINDVLMVIFFFVVGLEIRREIHRGELSDPKRAALPIAAAVGGMAVPAIVYVALNPAGAARSGWGVPMATDIAFAVGVLTLLGKRVAPALRVLLLALAVIDDLGAIVVIALFYSSGVSVTGLAVVLAGIAGVLLLQRFGVRRALAYVVPGVVIWAGTLRAGIHPTIAGVILGLLTPARSWFGERGFVAEAEHALGDFKGHTRRADHRADDLIAPLGRLKNAGREAVSPVVRMQAALHGWVAYGIMPLFALANAGVSLRGVSSHGDATPGVVSGVVAGLVLGKPIGILLASFVARYHCAAARGGLEVDRPRRSGRRDRVHDGDLHRGARVPGLAAARRCQARGPPRVVRRGRRRVALRPPGVAVGSRSRRRRDGQRSRDLYRQVGLDA
jgi:Na+:H+ antiporter, NhaA family